MFYFGVTMSKKVTVKKRDSEWAVLSVQDNEWWVFWPAQEVELSKEEITWLTFDEVMESIYWGSVITEPSKPFIILPKIMENKTKLVLWLVWMIIILSFWILFMLPKQSPETLKGQIKSIRQDRENKYNDCLAVCNAERSVYDAQVNHKKAILKKIEE